MKKFLALLLSVMMVLSLAACGSSNDNGGSNAGSGDTMDLKEMAVALTEGLDEDVKSSLAEPMTLDELADMMPLEDGQTKDQVIADLFRAKLFIPFIENAEVVVHEPAIGSTAHTEVLLRLPKGSDVEAVRGDIEANADPRWMICVEAEKVIVSAHGNTILLVMSDAKTADTIAANFDGLWK